MNGSASHAVPVLSGVPQGSVLGPLLFLIYIDGITTVTLSPNSHQTLYADDMLLYQPLLTVLTTPNYRKISTQYQSGLMVTTCNLTLKNVNSCESPENKLVSVLQLCISVVSHYKRWTPTNILGSACHQIYHGHSISNQPVAKRES